MNTEQSFLEYAKEAKQKFLAHIEKMKPELYTNDRVQIENFVIAYDQLFDSVEAGTTISNYPLNKPEQVNWFIVNILRGLDDEQKRQLFNFLISRNFWGVMETKTETLISPI